MIWIPIGVVVWIVLAIVACAFVAGANGGSWR